MFGVGPEYDWEEAMEEAKEDLEYARSLMKEGSINTARAMLKLTKERIIPFELKIPKDELRKIRKMIKDVEKELKRKENLPFL